MYAVQHGLLALAQEIGGADVGREHAFLDHAVSVVATCGNDASDLAFVVENDLRFDRFEIDRSACFACTHEHLEETIEIIDVRGERTVALRRIALGIVEHLSHDRVRETRMRSHDCRVKLITDELAFGRDLHVADHAQPIDLRVERAQIVRKPFRQHRNHAARKVDRVTSSLRFMIERIPMRHVMTDVSDRNEQAETAFRAATLRRQWLAVNRVVEIPRRLPVDRDERQIANVDSAFAIGSAI